MVGIILQVILIRASPLIAENNHAKIMDNTEGISLSEKREEYSSLPNVQPRSNTDPKTFLSVWDTRSLSIGSSAENQICLPLIEDGNYNFLVQWGDENSDVITSYVDPKVTHTYDIPGFYNVNITGILVGWQFNNEGDKLKIREISQWGTINLGNNGKYFDGCTYLELSATDALDLTGTTNLNRAFGSCWFLGVEGNLNKWNVSRVTDMGGMFEEALSFNQPMDTWDVSRVEDMESMFKEASTFNQPIGVWDVSCVADMGSMFKEASAFNQPIGAWNVSCVTDMGEMFSDVSVFNQDIGEWNVSRVTDMGNMFFWANSFNQDIGEWNVSRVTDMGSIFFWANSFNQDIGEWNVSCVTDMNSMFCSASTFNHDIGDWNVSRVTDMRAMFFGASSFNQDIGEWSISRVTDMENMFREATLSTKNYNSLLQGWGQIPLQHYVQFHAGNSQYDSQEAVMARESIINTYSWTITDNGSSSLAGNQSFLSKYSNLIIGISIGIVGVGIGVGWLRLRKPFQNWRLEKKVQRHFKNKQKQQNGIFDSDFDQWTTSKEEKIE